MENRIQTVAQSVKASPRLASIQDPQKLVKVLKTRYTSELDAWMKVESKDTWKHCLVQNEKEIRQLQKKIRELEADIW